MKIKGYIILLLLFALNSCVKTPTSPVNDESLPSGEAIIVLCEGLNGYNNAELNILELNTGKTFNKVFEQINKFPLGDIANDIVRSDNFIYIVVSTSKLIYKINLSTWKVEGKTIFTGNNFPRKLIINENFGFVTDAYSSKVNKIDLSSMLVIDSVQVGPQPEGISIHSGKLFIVNSGWGDINKDAEDASTISVVDINNFSLIKTLNTGANPVEIITNAEKNKLYVCYYNLPSLKDSLGGIIQYEMNTLHKSKEWRGNFSEMKLSTTGDSIIVLNGGFQQKQINEISSIQVIDLKTDFTSILLENPTLNEKWYNFEIDYQRNQLIIANAKNFQSKGELLIFDMNSKLTKPKLLYSVETGINPHKIIPNIHL
jgi:hypothetical protein